MWYVFGTILAIIFLLITLVGYNFLEARKSLNNVGEVIGFSFVIILAGIFWPLSMTVFAVVGATVFLKNVEVK